MCLWKFNFCSLVLFTVEPMVKRSTEPTTSKFIKRKRDNESCLTGAMQNLTTSTPPETGLRFDNVTVSPQNDDPAFHYQPSNNAFRFNFDVSTDGR